MVLEKASPEENSGYKNAESNSSSENEKHQKYEIEVCRTFVLLFYRACILVYQIFLLNNHCGTPFLLLAGTNFLANLLISVLPRQLVYLPASWIDVIA